MTEPTDADIDALWVGQQLTVPQLVQRRVIARAVLAKWGVQPVPAGYAAQGDAEDAARYRWLRERMLGVDFDWNESGITALSFEMPDGCAYGGCCNQNIDAARKQGGGENAQLRHNTQVQRGA